MSCPDCDYIGIGDVVEHKMNTGVFGIVIGESGSLIYIRVSPSLAVLTFHEWELRHVSGDREPPVADTSDNVIKVNFTERGPLRKTTKTEGNA